MEPKKLLIMGSDLGSLDMALEGKKRGLYVITTDLMDTSPTKEASDEAWMISTRDVDVLEKKCIENGINAITTGAHDGNITCYRELCKRLNLPMYCKSDKSWAAATNKRLFKDIAISVGALVAEDYKVSDCPTDEELEKIKYPVVLKPIDCQGNMGVSYCNNGEELINAIKLVRDVSDSEVFICERQLRGKEYYVNYVLADGEVRFLSFTAEHAQPGEKVNLYSMINSTSGGLKQYLEEMNEYVVKIFKEAECTDGLAWVETILDEDGHYYLIEMGHRFGGDMMYSEYAKICGFDAVAFMMDCVLGVRHTAEDLPVSLDKAYTQMAASYHLFTRTEGKIAFIEGLEEIERNPAFMVDIPRRIGNIVRYHACMGVIRIYGDNCVDLCEKVAYINSRLKIKNENGENMFIYFNDFDAITCEYNNGLRDFNLI